METSLHRALKRFYAAGDAATEVRLGRYRIDVVRGDELIEIQHGSLAALREKIRLLTATHDVRIVKPIVVRKMLVKLARRNGPIVERRTSPKRGKWIDLFDELIFLRHHFPHPRLTIEAALVDVEETRYPGRGRRRRRRRNAFQTADQRLTAVHETRPFRNGDDLIALLPEPLPMPFHTGDVAAGLGIHRSFAQRILYCLREMKIAVVVGKRRNALLYRWQRDLAAQAPPRRPRRAG